MDKILENTLLYDFYGPLLTPHQRSIFEDVRFRDLSLSEAAEEYGVSRQGIHDQLKRIDALLTGYEEKLGLVARFAAVKALTGEMRKALSRLESGPEEDRSSVLRELSEKLGRLEALN